MRGTEELEFFRQVAYRGVVADDVNNSANGGIGTECNDEGGYFCPGDYEAVDCTEDAANQDCHDYSQPHGKMQTVKPGCNHKGTARAAKTADGTAGKVEGAVYHGECDGAGENSVDYYLLKEIFNILQR